MLSQPSTRPSDATGRRSSAFVRERRGFDSPRRLQLVGVSRQTRWPRSSQTRRFPAPSNAMPVGPPAGATEGGGTPAGGGGGGGGGAALGPARGPAAGDVRDGAVAVHAAHAVVRAVGDQDVLVPVEQDLGGEVEQGVGGRPAVAAVAAVHEPVIIGGDLGGAGDGADPPVGAHAADAVVVLVGDE